MNSEMNTVDYIAEVRSKGRDENIATQSDLKKGP